MTVARRGADNDPDEFLWRSETVRLGQGLEQTGQLSADRIAAALVTLGRFAAEARGAGAARLLGVATEAVRVATNGEEFLRTVRERTGIDVQTISGDREAKLTFLGLKGVVDLSGDVAIADIGGASTEIILARNERIDWSQSFALGSGRLTDRFVRQDPPTSDELAACRTEARAVVAAAPFGLVRGGRLIVVGGTGEYLDRLTPAEHAHDEAALAAVSEYLTAIPAADLAARLAIAEARARVLPAGVAIARGVADLQQPVAFAAAMSGIRGGLLLAAFAGEI
jgi:exopolyphosphatase/guanosine-5'-triphosphate,3'-diphosphate pyrophosphatase